MAPGPGLLRMQLTPVGLCLSLWSHTGPDTQAAGISLLAHKGPALALFTQLTGPSYGKSIRGAETGAMNLGGDLHCSQEEWRASVNRLKSQPGRKGV